jgi:hypothetical protein
MRFLRMLGLPRWCLHSVTLWAHPPSLVTGLRGANETRIRGTANRDDLGHAEHRPAQRPGRMGQHGSEAVTHTGELAGGRDGGLALPDDTMPPGRD